MAVYDRLMDAQRSTPGVLSVAAAKLTPISGMVLDDAIEVAGLEGWSPDQRAAHINGVSPGYFETLGIALRAGRDFDMHDTAGSPPVAVVSESFARKFFPGRNPIGERFGERTHDAGGNSSPARIVEIVGVVADTKYESLRAPIPPTAYLAMSQDASHGNILIFAVRTAGEPNALIRNLSQAIGNVSKDITYDFSTLAAQVDDSLIQERLLAELAGFFGALALFVACIGLYGVMWLAMTRRRSEIGIRMALGAEPATVIRMVLREVAMVAALGFAVGSAIAIAAGRLVTNLLFALTSTDASTWLLAIALLGGAATLASYLPVRHASRVDPMVALREE